MFDQITRDHILSAFSQANRDGVKAIQTHYVAYNKKKYPVKPIVWLAYKIAYGVDMPVPNFNSMQAIQILNALKFQTYTTKSPEPLTETPLHVAQPLYTWVPFYEEICSKLLDYSPAQLVNLASQVVSPDNQVGLKDRDTDGNQFDLAEIDPYTFLSFLNKTGDAKRLDTLNRVRQAMNLTTSTPTDVKGIPNAQAQSVWMFGYSYKRAPDDIPKLRSLYEQVTNSSVTAEQFESVLTIYKVGAARLTQVLFYQKPTEYLPIDVQTKLWLKKRGLPYSFEAYAEYLNLMAAVKKYDKRPFYEISREAFLESSAQQPSEQKKYYCVGTSFGDAHGGDQLIRFLEKGIWQSGFQDKNASLVNSISVGAKLAAKTTFTRGINNSISVLRVRSIGTVISNLNDGRTLEVAWEDDFDPFELDGKGSYQSTVQKVSKPEDIQLIFFHEADQPEEITSMQDAQSYPYKNIILYGPPGTGKTYETINLAVDIIESREQVSQKIPQTKEQRAKYQELFKAYRTGEQIDFVTFHQNYTYEDFVTGLKPATDGGDLKFEQRYGIFYQIAKRARDNYSASQIGKGIPAVRPFQVVFDEFMQPLVDADQEICVKMASGVEFVVYDVSERSISFRKANGSTLHTLSITTLREIYEGTQEIRPNGLRPYYQPLSEQLAKLGQQIAQKVALKNYVLIVDEINRANMSRVFGELITLLEDDKRLDEPNELTITLPSGEPFSIPPNLYLIGTMNTADKSLALLDIALRRRFEFIYQKPDSNLLQSPAREILDRLNSAIRANHKSADFLIGHAYFIGKSDLASVFNNRVIPLLMEYFNGNTKTVAKLLGEAGITTNPDEITDQLLVSYVE